MWPLARLFLLGDDVHGHEDVERVVDAAPDVLLVELLPLHHLVGALHLRHLLKKATILSQSSQ